MKTKIRKSEKVKTINKLMESVSVSELEAIKKEAEDKLKDSVNFDLNTGSELPF
jgi:hypothetical protein